MGEAAVGGRMRGRKRGQKRKMEVGGGGSSRPWRMRLCSQSKQTNKQKKHPVCPFVVVVVFIFPFPPPSVFSCMINKKFMNIWSGGEDRRVSEKSEPKSERRHGGL